jgi:golgi apparatus protein 1
LCDARLPLAAHAPCIRASQGARSRSGQLFTIGVVGRCLSKAMIEGQRLEPSCKQLVLAAAPKDFRHYFEGSDPSSSAVLQMVS